MTNQEFTAEFQRERLHTAAQDGDLALVEKWLSAKYPVNRFDSLGKTSLNYAVDGEHFDVVDRLLEAGADVNAHDERVIGNTPLRDAIRDCSYRMAKWLIDAGADPTIPGWMQMSAIDGAMQRKDADAKKILRLLREAGEKQKSTD